MKKVVYSPEVRREIINRYHQSGLSPHTFCKLPDVPICAPTLREWLKRYQGSSRSEVIQSPSAENLTIACYAITEDATKAEAVTLEEMIKFRKDVHDCCHHLYQLSCNKKTIPLLAHIMEVL